MKIKLLEILVCPKCKTDLSLQQKETLQHEIIEGDLLCENCRKKYPIVNGIPRFIELDNYASSFGYQWNLFRKEQIDSHNGTDLSAERFWAETGWDKDSLNGKWILDAGCGAGRFLDIASTTKSEVVGIDISSAIDAAQENLKGRQNVHFIQASIYELPFRDETFDRVYCIGVIQHTPDPKKTMETLPKFVKKDGQIAVTIYEKNKYTLLYAKYLLRPITRRVPQKTLLNLLKATMPVMFPVTSFLFRLPKVGKVFAFLIPIANYVHEPRLNKEQRYNWALLDTFDMLSPAFDQPQTEENARTALSQAGVSKIERLPNVGLNLIGRKQS